MATHAPAAHAQQGTATVSNETLAVLVASIVAVVALALYVSRAAIMRKKTDYDGADYASKSDRTGEKYSSGWHDDYERPGSEHATDDDHYATLGIEKKATARDIKERYRELAKRHHPDRDGGDAAELVRINRAYGVLSDPESRREYDRSLGQGTLGSNDP